RRWKSGWSQKLSSTRSVKRSRSARWTILWSTSPRPCTAILPLCICTPRLSRSVRAHGLTRGRGGHPVCAMFRAGVIAGLALLVLQAVPAAADPPTTFNPVVEAQNFSITQQRQAVYDTPQYQAQLAADSAASTAQALATEAADPGRFFTD